MSDPVCSEVDITVTSGGKVQIVKFDLQNEFSFGYSEKYTVPADWSADRFEAWLATKTAAIKEKVDAFAQVEQDALLEVSDWYAR